MKKITLSTIKNDLLSGKDLYEAFGFIFESDCMYSTTVKYVIDKVFGMDADSLNKFLLKSDSLSAENYGLVSQVLILCWFEKIK